MKNRFISPSLGRPLALAACLFLAACLPMQAQDIVPDSVLTLADSTVVENYAAATDNYATAGDARKETERQQKVWNKRKKYMQVGYLTQTTKVGDPTTYNLKSSAAFAFTMGRTYYLHKKPLGGMVKFGIDFSYFNLRYADYKKDAEAVAGSAGDFSFDGPTIASTRQFPGYDDYDEEDYNDFDIDLGTRQLSIGLQVGPSVTVNPIHELKVAVYFRYSPTYDLFLANDDFGSGYASYFNYGLSVSWKIISLGVELYNGSTKYKHDGFSTISSTDGKVKFKTSGTNFFVALRF